MCVILHGLSKSDMKKEEIKQAMVANKSGFFMARLYTKNGVHKRECIRTLAQNEILDFFDNKVEETDEVVLHARIPSYGGDGLHNVHGWEIDGIMFCHNMSIHAIDGFRNQYDEWKTKTDSEFFFTKLFIPYYRSLGEKAYKNGKFHEDLDKFVTWMCGTTNKFLFIMPDNRVIRYGNWVTEADRKKGDEYTFFASNSSYKVYTPTWKGGAMVGTKSTRFRYDPYDMYDYDYDYDYNYGFQYHSPKQKAKAKIETDSDNSVSLDLLGYKSVAKLALSHLVVKNVMETRLCDLESLAASGEASILESCIAPDLCVAETDDAVMDIECLVTESSVMKYIENYAVKLDETMLRQHFGTYKSTSDIQSVLADFEDQLSQAKNLLNIFINFSKTSAEEFATAFIMDVSEEGIPSMEKLDPIDILVPRTCIPAAVFESINEVLKFINKPEETK